MATRRFRIHEIEAALRNAGGVYAHAANLLQQATGRSCTRQNIHKWVTNHPALMQTVQECVEEIKYLAETKLIQNIKNNDTSAITFYLKMKTKDRGYVNQRVLTGADGQPLNPPARVLICLPDNGRDPALVKSVLGEPPVKTNGSQPPFGPSSLGP
jgi:hypothetical protein